jgi:hypothetical protein
MCSATIVSKDTITEYIIEFHESVGENEVYEWCTLNLLHSTKAEIISVTRMPSVMDSVTSNNQSCMWKIQICSNTTNWEQLLGTPYYSTTGMC